VFGLGFAGVDDVAGAVVFRGVGGGDFTNFAAGSLAGNKSKPGSSRPKAWAGDDVEIEERFLHGAAPRVNTTPGKSGAAPAE
jgi:hypothetical protein